MKRQRRPGGSITAAAAAAGTALLAGTIAWAASSGSGNASRPDAPVAESSKDEAQALFDRGMKLVEDGNFEAARERFEKAVAKTKNDPDYLNMLAYTQRKTGHLDDAFETYEKALGQRAKFPQAREYLGEAHLQAALLQVEVLRGYGAEGKKQLDELVAAFQRAATTLQAEPMGAGNANAGVDPKAW